MADILDIFIYQYLFIKVDESMVGHRWLSIKIKQNYDFHHF